MIVHPVIEEAAMETIVLLGESDEPQAVLELLASWKPSKGRLTPRLQLLLRQVYDRLTTTNKPI